MPLLRITENCRGKKLMNSFTLLILSLFKSLPCLIWSLSFEVYCTTDFETLLKH